MTDVVGKAITEFLAGLNDLDVVVRAVAREHTIRQVVAETGEDRKTIADMLDAQISMDQESVLSLMDGEPTTLADGLRRYVDQLDPADENLRADTVITDLDTLLAYPWPGAPAAQGDACATCAETLAREVHQSYIKLAPKHGYDVIPWAELSDDERALGTATMADLMDRGVIRPVLHTLQSTR